MFNLLNDRNTYEETTEKIVATKTEKFTQTMKKLIENEDPKWKRMLNYHPRTPKMYGLPKTHKPEIPMRPIISGIGSAPHKIARATANILTPLLGTINPSHIKNSGDLIHKLEKINMKNKEMASLDVKSLYTSRKMPRKSRKTSPQ